MADPHQISRAATVLHVERLAAAVAQLTVTLGFRIERVFPADDPREVIVVGFGSRLLLRRGPGEPVVVEIVDPAATASEDIALEGHVVRRVPAPTTVTVPPCRGEVFLTRADGAWIEGRAGMQYRDLVPGRFGGRFIASHIRIVDGGPVPDWVHYHRIAGQAICCVRGWIRVVYEDQGPPLVMREGDCVLQPPQIRHRVLECSAGAEVVEISTPAEHDTWADAELSLPTAQVRRDRDFGGQRFVHHVAADAAWTPWRGGGLQGRRMQLGEASGGVLEGWGLRPVEQADGRATWDSGAELSLLFVRRGTVQVSVDDATQPLEAGDAIAIDAGHRCAVGLAADTEAIVFEATVGD